MIANKLILGIDASSIQSGGGLTHLIELLRAADPTAHGFSSVIVWGSIKTLSQIEDRNWLVKHSQPAIEKGFLSRIYWQVFVLSKLAREAHCSVLFVPSGSYAGRFTPFVTFSQNLLPFDWSEQRRFGWAWITVKFSILRLVQGQSFVRASGVIFLTNFAREVVLRNLRLTLRDDAIISHGLDRRFLRSPRDQFPISNYSVRDPFRILYVSQINMYKHQWHVVQAVAMLRQRNFPIVLDLVGPAYKPALNLLNETLRRVDANDEFTRYLGPVSHSDLPQYYFSADLFVFASSCETFGQILTEAMSAGLPLACSNRSAMPEILCDAGIYFDPEDSNDIAHALSMLIESPALRARLALAAYTRAQDFSWQRCADETFEFIERICRKHR